MFILAPKKVYLSKGTAPVTAVVPFFWECMEILRVYGD